MRRQIDSDTRVHLLGRRVVVRFRLHDDVHAATDVLGVLESWDDGLLRVRRTERGGNAALTSLAEIRQDDVLAVKAIPARPVTRRAVRDLEAAAAQGWRGSEHLEIGGWLLRAAGGFTRRANSCLPLDDPGLPLDEAIETLETWYRERGLPPVFQVPRPLAGALGPALDTRGWAHGSDVLVLTGSVADVGAAVHPSLPAVRIEGLPDKSWLTAYHYRGDALPPHAVEVLTDADEVGFASVDQEGERAAIARGAVSTAPSGRRWLGVTAVEVIPSARRRGLGSHVVAGLARWAAGLDASDVYLQVEEANTGAQAAYRKLGFGDHHTYHYRQAPV